MCDETTEYLQRRCLWPAPIETELDISFVLKNIYGPLFLFPM